MANVTGKELNAYYDSIVSMIKKIMESTDIDYAHRDLMLYIIENIVKCIANDRSFEATYKTDGDRIKADIQLTNNEIEDDDEEEEDELSEIGDNVSVRTEKADDDTSPFKLKSEEAHIIDVMMDRISDRVNSIDCEVEAIKDHLTELGLGLDATCDNSIDDCTCNCDERAGAAKKVEYKDIYPWPVFECGVEDDDHSCDCDEDDKEPELHKPLTYKELVDKVRDGVLTIDDKFDIVADGLIELLNRTRAIEAFCSQVCDTIAADKKLSKTFNKCAKAKNKKYKAIKAVKKATE